jgi:hypothetical protein
MPYFEKIVKRAKGIYDDYNFETQRTEAWQHIGRMAVHPSIS